MGWENKSCHVNIVLSCVRHPCHRYLLKFLNLKSISLYHISESKLISSVRDVVFVLDSSSYVSAEDFEKMKKFVKNIIKVSDIDGGKVRFGVISYSSKPSLDLLPNSYETKAEVLAAVDRIPYQGGSANIAGALRNARELFTKSAGGMLLFLVFGSSIFRYDERAWFT